MLLQILDVTLKTPFYMIQNGTPKGIEQRIYNCLPLPN